ncbi:MAG: dihydrolipoyl dehydrogenase [Acidimicrobiales bacterium]
MTDARSAHVLIIGGGPAGYVAGIRCGQHGLDTVVVDVNPPGGTCLNVGCIPSKALIHAADEFARATAAVTGTPTGITVADPTIDLATTVSWKDGIVDRLTSGVGGLLKRAGTELVVGRATVVDGKTADVVRPDGSVVRVTADHLVLATGSVPVELPELPFGGHVLSSTEALDLTVVPPTLAVVGGGYIGVELGTAFAKLGSHVTLIEATDRILPGYDRELVAPVERRLDALDVTVLTSSRAGAYRDGRLALAPTACSANGGRGLKDDGTGGPHGRGPGRPAIPAERVLVTVGRTPAVTGWGLDRLPVERSGPFVAVDGRCATSMRNVWAIGDLTGEPMLAHRAMAQAEVVAEAIAGGPAVFDPAAIPAVVFSDPEIVSVGLDPAAAAAAVGGGGDGILVGGFPLAANGRAMTRHHTDGFVRVVARADDHLVLGAQAVGVEVSELAAELTLMIEMAARLEDLTGTIHTHPTVGEAVAEAAAAALGRPLHR